MNASPVSIPNRGSDFQEHQPILFYLCQAFKVKSALELGVRDGQSTVALLSYAEDKNIKILSVDKEPPTKGLLDIISDRKWNQYWEFIQSDDMKVELQDRKFDLVFIDTSHTYDQTMNELVRFFPLAKKLMVFHDTSPSPENEKEYGVKNAISDFMCNKDYCSVSHFTNNNGLTIIVKDFEE